MSTDSSFLQAVFRSGFRLKLKSVAMMASSRQCLLEEEIEQREELTASDKSSCSDNDDSSGTDILTIVEVTGSECNDSENEDGTYCFQCYIYVGGHDEYHQQKGRPGQQMGVQCVIKTIEGRRQSFGAPNVKQPCVLKDFSRHFTPS
jgi:hypothetical protein